MSDWLPDLNFANVSQDNQPIRLSYWDFWLLIVLSQYFKGDWDLLVDHFRTKAKPGGFERERAEGSLNHLRQLRRALDEADLPVQDVLSNLDATLIKANKAKARRKVLDMQFQEHECSRWMIETPRWQNDLALAVYEASLSPGRHEKYLGEQYEMIKLRLQAQS